MEYDKYNPEFYGYTIGQNIVPFINKIIYEIGQCHLTEGTHICGRNDRDWNIGNIWQDNCITWGWGRTDGVKLIGAGYDKTTLKFIDNVQSAYLLDKPQDYILMLQTKYDQSCNNTLIQGITWDGNYANNNSTTLFGIRIRGENNTVTSCRFINFGVGASQKSECFQVNIVPIDPTTGAGPTISNCIFEMVGNKTNSPAGYVPENTFIAVGGKNVSVKSNIFRNCVFDKKTQQSPLHGITLGNVYGGEIEDNTFDGFQGTCIYTDSWRVENVTIYNNKARNVWSFIGLSSQNWNNPDQIAFYKNYTVFNNKVQLSIGEAPYEWDIQGGPSVFFGYNNDPSVDRIKYPGFENVSVYNNIVILGYYLYNGTYQESPKSICYYGPPVGSDKINIYNNSFTSSIPSNRYQINILYRMVTFFKKLFGI
jgi:hypothetical protein